MQTRRITLLLSLVLFCWVSHVEARQTPPPPPLGAREVTIAYTPVGFVRSIALAGEFNHWSTTANLLSRPTRGAAWSTTLTLEPGVYPFKYFVDGQRWVNDQSRPSQRDDSGNVNSLLIVAPIGYEEPCKVGDGRITETAVRHLPNARYVVRLDTTHLQLTLRTRKGDVERCWVFTQEQETGNTMRLMPENAMARDHSDLLFDYWHGTLPVPKSGPLHYEFLLEDGKTAQVWDAHQHLHATYAADEWFTVKPSDYPPFEIPIWARDAVFYQIFPDRFADGDPANNGSDTIPWGGPASSSKYMGGDLAGILQHTDYLRDLGINALYLNPIFTARSSHGYDTTDYHEIDPHFGTAQTLQDLTAKAHSLGWHVLLDGVFNHTGVDFVGFRSLLTEGEKSPYRQWYYVRAFPVQVRDGQKNYVGWYGSPWMPKLNVDNPDTRAYLLDVGTRWIRDAHVDGWRLDAADEVDHSFWKAFRTAVRKAAPNAYLVGEIWNDATAWLQGDEFDSAMNYRWRSAALDFFALDRATPTQFDARLARIREETHPAADAVMFNMLDSHDTERLRTTCKGDWLRERQAILFQMTYPGVPCIYYGDEIGLEGGRDPDNRRAFDWNAAHWDQPTFAFYKRLLQLRRAHLLLRRGDYKPLMADDAAGLFAYTRKLGKAHLLVAFNRSDQPRTLTFTPTQIPSTFTEWLAAGAKVVRQGTKVQLALPARGIALLGAEKE
ncbi:MAG TPA: alpha amylase N-terminal ig-like domain-containing protein [Chthonomonadaceae bacterium]|nr:alpha amylase N-terminal ig-like domain-containing protein [Chthonomonadaceae bacterium]